MNKNDLFPSLCNFRNLGEDGDKGLKKNEQIEDKKKRQSVALKTRPNKINP